MYMCTHQIFHEKDCSNNYCECEIFQLARAIHCTCSPVTVSTIAMNNDIITVTILHMTVQIAGDATDQVSHELMHEVLFA